MLTRRTFVTHAPVVLVLTPLVSGCGAEGGGGSCDGAGADSTVSGDHRHFVCVPASDIANPPAGGATYTTSQTEGHTHDLTLSMDDLNALAADNTIEVTTAGGGHTHQFTLSQNTGSGSSGGYY